MHGVRSQQSDKTNKVHFGHLFIMHLHALVKYKTIQSEVDKDTVAARGSALVCERRHLRHEKCSHISSGLVAACSQRERREDTPRRWRKREVAESESERGHGMI